MQIIPSRNPFFEYLWVYLITVLHELIQTILISDTTDVTATTKLQTLNVNYNEISSVESKLLGRSPLLENLFISNNHLAISPNLSLVSDTLQSISLADNDIELLPSEYLKNMSVLKDLDLSLNYLKEFPWHTLKHMGKLNTLNLYGNVLTKISDVRDFMMTSSLSVNLYGIPLSCDSSLCWLLEGDTSCIQSFCTITRDSPNNQQVDNSIHW